jgi:hypothetical protein
MPPVGLWLLYGVLADAYELYASQTATRSKHQ